VARAPVGSDRRRNGAMAARRGQNAWSECSSVLPTNRPGYGGQFCRSARKKHSKRLRFRFEPCIDAWMHGGGGSDGGSGRPWLGSPTRTTSDGRVIKRRRFKSSLRVYECDWRLVLRAQPFPPDQQAFEKLQKSLRVAVMCGTCGVACATPQALAAHEKAGCPPRELVCSLCRRASKTRQGLQQHSAGTAAAPKRVSRQRTKVLCDGRRGV
jgi:hypothetical protein